MSNEKFFSSDWHLGHEMIRQKYRSHFVSVEEMSNYVYTLLRELPSGANLYFLGDLAMKRHYFEEFFKLLSTINIHFHWILGNHDCKLGSVEAIQNRYGKYCASISHIKEIKLNEFCVTLCHYPMISWSKSHYGAFQFFGHHHSNIIDDKFTGFKHINVGFDVNNFQFLSEDLLLTEMIRMNKLFFNWDQLNLQKIGAKE
jgi:calcineurin-like phosphoesterase family protein